MKAYDVIQLASSLADRLEDMGFSEGSERTAKELARAFAGSTLPARLFAEWLRRNPEAVAELDEALRFTEPRRTGPVASGTGGSVKAEGEAHDIGKWTVEVRAEVKPQDVPEVKPANSAQSSEPNRGPLPNVPIQHNDFVTPKSVPGTKGASAPSRVVNLGNAASVIGQSQFRTRPVSPEDVSPNALGNAPGFRGQAALLDADGKTLYAVCRFNSGERLVEFLDKRGPLIMCRLADGDDKGSVVNICIEFVEPERRAAVLETLNRLPGANDGFNFSPFDGLVDPWNPDALPLASDCPDGDELELPI